MVAKKKEKYHKNGMAMRMKQSITLEKLIVLMFYKN